MTYEEMMLAMMQDTIEKELYEKYKLKNLPTPFFLSIISTLIDHYIKDHSLNNREIWKALYEVSGSVYEECGDYGEEVKS